MNGHIVLNGPSRHDKNDYLQIGQDIQVYTKNSQFMNAIFPFDAGAALYSYNLDVGKQITQT